MLRLTGGVFCGRFIDAPRSLKTRPTQAKLRQALFNSLQAQIPDAVVLDLFAGSGALGFEALSRGASKVVFVELSESACGIIHKNSRELGVESQVTILSKPIEKVLPLLKPFSPFDLIFADPPYAGGWELKLISQWPWSELLVEEGRLCMEWGLQKSQAEKLPDETPFLVKIREKNYGDSILTTYQRN